jgi:hypothetical protein
VCFDSAADTGEPGSARWASPCLAMLVSDSATGCGEPGGHRRGADDPTGEVFEPIQGGAGTPQRDARFGMSWAVIHTS